MIKKYTFQNNGSQINMKVIAVLAGCGALGGHTVLISLFCILKIVRAFRRMLVPSAHRKPTILSEKWKFKLVDCRRTYFELYSSKFATICIVIFRFFLVCDSRCLLAPSVFRNRFVSRVRNFGRPVGKRVQPAGIRISRA